MNLDHFVVDRLARDLQGVLAGSRIDGFTASNTGIIFFCYRRGKRYALHILVDSGSPTACAYELGEARKENGPLGWASGVVTLLRGATIDAIHAVPDDRVLYVDVSSRSTFGVPSRSRIVAELQPRKANALVLRETSANVFLIVAAAKQFAAAAGVRNIRTGERYEAPPPRRSTLDRARFIVEASEAAPDAARLARLLAQLDPACSPPLAREVVYRADRVHTSSSARTLIDGWTALHAEVEDALQDARPVVVMRRQERVVACHLIRLGWIADSEGTQIEQVKTVNELCVAELLSARKPDDGQALQALHKRLATMLARATEEGKSLEAARARAADAEEFRVAGETIYAHLSEIQTPAQSFTTEDGRRITLDPLLTAKQNAAEYFRKYKKARSGLPRIAARLRVLRANREYWEHLAWELDRASDHDAAARSAIVAEVAAAVGVKRKPQKQRAPKAGDRTVSLPGGAIALVGRSPKDNERLTFSVAGPNDYWFHVRGVPGAHVIVKTQGRELAVEQIEAAAAVAAGHSRAVGATSVEVDYTRRKHVRR
ncbi:MAG: NFACT family protein, partial [Candidatus Eremiobacteraeota bacterium]|nr:NFACT family protein [Candidatus Eremiobacteraeota bacterium]